jgi:hypothetical protein
MYYAIYQQMPTEPPSQNSGVQIAVFRQRVSEILLHNTVYDVVPVSSKVRFFFCGQHCLVLLDHADNHFSHKHFR